MFGEFCRGRDVGDSRDRRGFERLFLPGELDRRFGQVFLEEQGGRPDVVGVDEIRERSQLHADPDGDLLNVITVTSNSNFDAETCQVFRKAHLLRYTVPYCKVVHIA